MNNTDFQQSVYESMSLTRGQGMFLSLDDVPTTGRYVSVDGERLLHFGSCSYLGLETDERLTEGAVAAARRYGTQFSSSRAYASSPLYAPLEAGLSTLFGGHALLTPTTTLGHISTLPVLIGERDAIVIDHQAHHSMHIAVTLARASGTAVQVVRHGATARAEQAIEQLIAEGHPHVWYILDGVFSMFGDLPDVLHLQRLLARHPQLHLYVDDAHGTSIAGQHGRGVHLSRMPPHPRMVIAASLCKAFAGGGGCIIFPTAEARERVRLCGGPMLFSGPIQPPTLGVLQASLKIHLSPEITRLQAELQHRIQTLNRLLKERDLPLLAANQTPIFFLKAGLPELGARILERLRAEEGILVNLSIHPAVPSRRAGVRLAVTRHHTLDDLERLADALARQYPLAEAEIGFSRAEIEACFASLSDVAGSHRHQIAQLFGSPTTTSRPSSPPLPDAATTAGLRLEHHGSRTALDGAEWDRLLGHRGSFEQAGLALLEQVFTDAPAPEHRWTFHYMVVRDADGTPILATFFTEALWKDDMLMSTEVSRLVEQRRADDPYWMTSRCLAMGSLLTEGDHLYLDRDHPRWADALRLLLAAAGRLLESSAASAIILRDLDDNDEELGAMLLPLGYQKLSMPSGYVLPIPTDTIEAYLATRGRSARRFIQQKMQAREPLWAVHRHHIDGDAPPLDDAMLDTLQGLYRNVADQKLRLNVFPLPRAVLEAALVTPGWEVLTLHPRDEAGVEAPTPLAFAVCHVGRETYTALYCGLDYSQLHQGGYRQLLWQTLLRSRETGCTRLSLGMDADQEKLRLGAAPRAQCAYLLTTDHFNATTLEQIAQDAALSRALP